MPATSVLIDDRYRLVDLIGRGERAAVWSAVDLRLGRTVAVKLFPSSGLQTADALAATACAWTSGASRVFDAAADVDLCGVAHTLLVRELVAGDAVDIWACSGASCAALADVGARVAGTLAGLHRQGAAHGAVTSSNILIGGGAEGRDVVLTDLGIRRMMTGHVSRPAQDVRQLGLTLLGALTGSDVVGTRMARAALQHLRRGAHLRLCEARAWTAVLAAMVDDDDSRRPDAAACATAFVALVQRSSTSVRPDTRANALPWEVIFSGA